MRWIKRYNKEPEQSYHHYLAAPILAQSQEEMMKKGLVFSISQSKHHQLSTPYMHRQ